MFDNVETSNAAATKSVIKSVSVKNKTPQLSIVIPTLDRNEEFPGAIISAINSDETANIIISQNNSNKITRDACGVIKDPRILLKYWEKRLPIGDHWSTAIHETVNTKYYTLIPDDDRISEGEYYKLIINALSNNNCVAGFADKRLEKIIHRVPNRKISGNIIIINGNDFLKILRSDIDGVLDICPTHFTTVLRTDVAKEVGLYSNCHSPDLLLFANICKTGDILVFLGNPGNYKWNENGLSKKPNVKMLVNEIMEIKKMRFSLDSNINEKVKIRLLIRTKRALYVALIKSLRMKLYSESYYAISHLGIINLLKLTSGFVLRLISGRWPKLDPFLP